MVATDTRPLIDDDPELASVVSTSILDATDHKAVGRLMIALGALFALAGLGVGVAAAFESADPTSFDLGGDADTFTQVWSLGRDLLLFGGLVPLFIGLALYLVPLQVGSPSLVFARGAAAGLWTWLLGTGLLIGAYILNGGPGGGRRDFVVLWAGALAMMIGGLVWAMVCVATTIIGARTQGMTLERVPLTTWSFFVFCLVGIFALPILMGELLLVYLRVRYGQLGIADSSILVGVMNGATVAPAAYWLGIPVLGMGADIIATHSGIPARLHRSLMGAIGAFGIFTFFPDLVGFGTVRSIPFDNGLRVVGLLVLSLPVLATLALTGDSIRRGTLKLTAPMIGALVSGLLLLTATAVSILAQIQPIMGFLDRLVPDQIDMTNTLILNGTTFHEGVRALASGAALVAVAAAVSHWGIKIWGRQPAQPVALAAIAASAGGAVLWAVGEILAGFDDQPMYPGDSAELGSLASGMGFVSMVGVAVMAVGALALLGSIAGVALGRNAGTGPQDWKGTTLEWATASPPPIGNFAGPPVVTSANPLLDGELVYANAAGGEGDGDDDGEQSESEDA